MISGLGSGYLERLEKRCDLMVVMLEAGLVSVSEFGLMGLPHIDL